MMAKRYVVRLSEEEKKQLTSLLGKKVLASKKRMRAQVLLKADAAPRGRPGSTAAWPKPSCERGHGGEDS